MGGKGFVYANGRVSGEETTLLDRRMWQMLVSASDEEEAMRLLGDTWYGQFMQSRTLDACLECALAATEDELISLSEDERLVRGILRRRDVRNARYVWKAALLGVPEEEVTTERDGLLEVDTLRRAVRDDEARSSLPDLFSEALDDLEAMDGPGPVAIDRRMDRLAADVELAELPALGPEFARFVRDRMELKNFLTAGRCRVAGLQRPEVEALLLPGGHHTPEEVGEAYQRGSLGETLAETPGLEELASELEESIAHGSFYGFERESDRKQLERLEQGTYPVFGPIPLASFVARREMEIVHLRLLLAAKSADIGMGRLRDRLPRG